MADWYELLLCQVHLRTGRTADAGDRLAHLVEPHRDVTTRFSATRARSSPLEKPQFSDANTPSLTPPSRVVCQVLTFAGAGHSAL